MVRRLIFRNIKFILYLFGLTILLIILTNPLVSAVVYSLIIDKNSIIISLPSPAEVFNRSLSSIRRVSYYVEIWAVAPEGIVEVLKTKAGPDNFMIKLTAREMMKIVSKWLDFYRSNGKFWRPTIIIQFSTYDPDENISILAFGASVTYDPEIFVSPMPRSEIHMLSIDRFPMIKKFVIERKEGSNFSFSSCHISFQGLPNPYDPSPPLRAGFRISGSRVLALWWGINIPMIIGLETNIGASPLGSSRCPADESVSKPSKYYTSHHDHEYFH